MRACTIDVEGKLKYKSNFPRDILSSLFNIPTNIHLESRLWHRKWAQISSTVLHWFAAIFYCFSFFLAGKKVGKATPFLIIYCECFISHEYDDALLSYTHKRISLPSMPPPIYASHTFPFFCFFVWAIIKIRKQELKLQWKKKNRY